MHNKLKIFLFIFLINIFFSSFSFWAINYSVTPIKQRIELDPGESVIKTAKITNRWLETVTLKISVSDLTAENITWNPILLTRKNEDNFEQTLAPWITLQTDTITLVPNQEKEIYFSLNIPNNATPWGHYWAIIFQDNNTNTPWVNAANVNVHYWSIIILKINWEVVVNWEIWNININSWLWSSKWLDKCPFWDFTQSNYDNKCVDLEKLDTFINPEKENKIEKESENNIEKLKKELEKLKKEKENIEKNFETYKKNWWEKQTIEEFEKEIQKKQKNIEKEIDKISKEFWVKFEIPITNKGNSHLYPEWKIVLKDEDWKIIKKIWKKVIINKKWLVIWNKIVDYLPINNSDWDVFPKKKRIMQVEWKWFPYETYNEFWEKNIKYFSPWEYYTNKAMWWDIVLMPWEKIYSKLNNKIITANTEIFYIDENWKKIITKKENKFPISYVEKYIWYNYYILISAWIIFLIFLLLFLLIFLNKRKCINCKKKIKKDMPTCPYCWIIQDGKNKWKKAKFKK